MHVISKAESIEYVDSLFSTGASIMNIMGHPFMLMGSGGSGSISLGTPSFGAHCSSSSCFFCPLCLESTLLPGVPWADSLIQKNCSFHFLLTNNPRVEVCYGTNARSFFNWHFIEVYFSPPLIQ